MLKELEFKILQEQYNLAGFYDASKSRSCIMDPISNSEDMPSHVSGPWVYQVFNLADVVEGANAVAE